MRDAICGARPITRGRTSEVTSGIPLGIPLGIPFGIQVCCWHPVRSPKNIKAPLGGFTCRRQGSDRPRKNRVDLVPCGLPQPLHFIFELELLLLQPPDLRVVGARAGHGFLDPLLQKPMLLCEFNKMRRHGHLYLSLDRCTHDSRDTVILACPTQLQPIRAAELCFYMRIFLLRTCRLV